MILHTKSTTTIYLCAIH